MSSGHCYRYTFTIADRVGNVSSTVTATAKVDTDAPSVSVTAPTELTGAGNQYYDAGSQTQFFRPAGSGSFSLHATASDGQSTVAQVAFPNVGSVSGWTGSIGGADGSSPYTSPNDYSWSSGATAPGARSITATNAAAIDGVATITLAADSTAPTGQALTLTGANAPYYNAASVTFSLVDGSDPAGGAGLDTSTRSVSRETGDLVAGNCSNFSPDAGSFSSPDTAVSTGHCYRYSFTIADNVGNVSNAVSATAKVDLDRAEHDDRLEPVRSVRQHDAELQLQLLRKRFDVRVPRRRRQLDAPAPARTSISPALTGGSHTFDVRATDAAGNTDATPASYTWTVDLTAPNTTIDSNPADPSNNTTPSFTFSSSEAGSSFECRVDGGSWTSCTSPESISPALTAGSHTFQVRATDAAGNTDATPASYTWTVDLTAPNTTIDSSPADPSNNTTPTSRFSSSEAGSSFECRVDGGSWTSCTSPETISPALTAGSHTFDVRATDAAGNTDATPASYTWTVDLTAPNTTIDSSPADPSNNTTPSFSSAPPRAAPASNAASTAAAGHPAPAPSRSHPH